MVRKKAQISLEYMIIVGFTVFVLSTLIALAFFYSNQVKGDVRINQIEEAARRIIDNAESVYYMGEPSKTTLDLTFPEGIKSISIENNYIIIEIYATARNKISYKSRVNIQGTLPISPGLKHITIEAKEDYVSIEG